MTYCDPARASPSQNFLLHPLQPGGSNKASITGGQQAARANGLEWGSIDRYESHNVPACSQTPGGKGWAGAAKCQVVLRLEGVGVGTKCFAQPLPASHPLMSKPAFTRSFLLTSWWRLVPALMPDCPDRSCVLHTGGLIQHWSQEPLTHSHP